MSGYRISKGTTEQSTNRPNDLFYLTPGKRPSRVVSDIFTNTNESAVQYFVSPNPVAFDHF